MCRVHCWVVLGLLYANGIWASPSSVSPEIRAQLIAKRSATLSAEISAVVKQLTVREGGRFKQGDLLVAFDCSIQQAQLQKTQATIEGVSKTYEANTRLAQLGSVSSLDVDIAKAKLGEAKADLSLTQASLQKCKINAPFSGRVVAVPAHEHQYLKLGDPLVEILDDSVLELRLIVPSLWLKWLKPGLEFRVQLDELNQDYPAQIDTIAANIDPVSQTVALIAHIKGQYPELLTGMSGKAIFTQIPAQ